MGELIGLTLILTFRLSEKILLATIPRRATAKGACTHTTLFTNLVVQNREKNEHLTK